MSDRPALTGKQVIRALSAFGFTVVRVTGSHHMLWKEGHPTVVPVPVHGNHVVPDGTLRSILRQAGLTYSQFRKVL